jgi:hypothetical protein
MPGEKKDFMEVRPISQGTDDLDYRFWQDQGPDAIFKAAWELAVEEHLMNGGHPDDLRLQRPMVSVEPVM